MDYFLMLTLPQLLLYVVGLPIAGTIHLMRNRDRLQDRQFYTRYGLLYLGYRADRAWWEVVVAVRKVMIVAVGTFGTLLGVVDLQAHLALLVVFGSIVAQFVGRPFDMRRPNTRLLHNLELTALSICWLTFWGGLLFFLGHEKENTVSKEIKVITTVCLVSSNCLFLTGSLVLFVKEYLNDRKKKERRRATKRLQAVNITNGTLVVPVHGDGEKDEKDSNDEGSEEGKKKDDGSNNEDDDSPSLDQSNTMTSVPAGSFQPLHHLLHIEKHRHEQTRQESDQLHADFDSHEEALQKKTHKRQKRHTDNVQLRLLARMKVKQSKAMSNVPMFRDLSPDAIEEILLRTKYGKHSRGEMLCRQGDLADCFYIIVSGNCSVHVETVQRSNGVSNDMMQRVGSLCELDFFGESVLMSASTEEDLGPRRNATVLVESEQVQVLKLIANDLKGLMERGVLTSEVIREVQETNRTRSEISRRKSSSMTTEVALMEGETEERTKEQEKAEANEEEWAVATEEVGAGANEEEEAVPVLPQKTN